MSDATMYDAALQFVALGVSDKLGGYGVLLFESAYPANRAPGAYRRRLMKDHELSPGHVGALALRCASVIEAYGEDGIGEASPWAYTSVIEALSATLAARATASSAALQNDEFPPAGQLILRLRLVLEEATTLQQPVVYIPLCLQVVSAVERAIEKELFKPCLRALLVDRVCCWHRDIGWRLAALEQAIEDTREKLVHASHRNLAG